jgi:hypothetical protein
MVRVDVGVEDVRDAHAPGGGEREIGLDVLQVGIDDRTHAQPGAAEQVRGAAGLEVVVGLEDHERRSFALDAPAAGPPVDDAELHAVGPEALLAQQLDGLDRHHAVRTAAIRDDRDPDAWAALSGGP